jgi:hypothetical protein
LEEAATTAVTVPGARDGPSATTAAGSGAGLRTGPAKRRMTSKNTGVRKMPKTVYCVNPHVEGHVVHYSDADCAKSQEKDPSANLARFLKPALCMSD